MVGLTTPAYEQYVGDGVAARAIGLGIQTIRVDGNDVLAVYHATKMAREIIVKEQKPAFIEAISYRIGDHSTTEFSIRGRPDEKELAKFKGFFETFGNPITRLEKYLLKRGLINIEEQEKIREETRKQTV